MIRAVLARLEPLLASGPIATVIAATILIIMVAGAVGTVRTGRWPFRLLLALSALLWPLPDHPFQGMVVVKISYLHGIHLADLLSVAAMIVAVLPWRRRRSTGESGGPPRAANGNRRPETRTQDR